MAILLALASTVYIRLSTRTHAAAFSSSAGCPSGTRVQTHEREERFWLRYMGEREKRGDKPEKREPQQIFNAFFIVLATTFDNDSAPSQTFLHLYISISSFFPLSHVGHGGI